MSAEATAFAWKCSPVTKSALLVHLALADVANDMNRNELWCSTDTVSRKTRVGRSVVVEAIDRLVELELLTVVKVRPGRTTLYRFLYPDLPIQFSDDPSEIGLRKSEVGVRKPDDTPPETGPELNRTQSDNLAAASRSEGQCTEWAPVDANNPTVARCALQAGHRGICTAKKPERELVAVPDRDRGDLQ